MIKKLTLSKNHFSILIKQENSFQKINFISACQLEGETIINPLIMVSVNEGADVFSLTLNLNPLTKEFNCVDVLETIKKMNVLPEFNGNILDISINQNYYKDQFCIELELEIE
jgi:hypothetical protein